MTRVVQLLLAFILVAIGLLSAPVTGQLSAEPSVGHSGDCTHTSITLYEGLNRTGDARAFCGNVSDLNQWVHTQAGNCDSHFLGDNSWDDCASSWYVSQNDHGYCVQIFGNPSYIFPLLEGGFFRAGQWSNFDGGTGSGGEENKATSIRWTATSICGSNP